MGPEKPESTSSAQVPHGDQPLGRRGPRLRRRAEHHQGDGQSQPLTVVENAPAFKVVVLNDADRLSKDAQHGLRRTMERYQQTCRIFLVAENAAYLIEPLRSRCLIVRVPRLGDEAMRRMLRGVAAAECPAVDETAVEQAVGLARGNARTAIMALQAGCRGGAALQDWREFLDRNFVDLIARRTSFALEDLQGFRSRLYEVLISCVSPDEVFCRIAEGLGCGFTGARSSASTSSGRPAGTSSRAGRATRRSSTWRPSSSARASSSPRTQKTPPRPQERGPGRGSEGAGMKNTVDAASQTTLGPLCPQERETEGTHPPPMPKKRRLVQSRDCHTLAGFEGDWPQRTDVHCWHCAHGFDSFPVGIPLAKRDGVYTLQGVYCSQRA